jgi:SecD/SecF fusion protein
VQNRRPHLILVALILLALGGVALIGVPGSPAQKQLTKGIDLQGGLEVVLEAVPPKGRPLQASDLDRAVTVMRSRVDKLGVSEPEIRKQGENQIVIQLPGVGDPKRAAEVIGKTAQLELFDLEADLTGPSLDANGQPVPHTNVFGILSEVGSSARRGKPAAYYLFNKEKRVVAGPLLTREELLRKQPGHKVPKGYRVLALPQKTIILTCGVEPEVVCPGVNEAPPTRVYFYLFRYQPDNAKQPIPEMTGADLKLSGTRQDFDPNTGEAIVLMQFTSKGGSKFHEITRNEAQRGQIRGVEQHFAIVLDREIRSFPSIDYKQYPDGIDPVNGAQITGIRSLSEAKDLAIVLQTGALPVRFVTAESTEVSATLGKDSLEEAQRAAIAGLLVVALFLLVFYRFLGLVAVLGLGIYVAFLYAAILIFNVTLTLPGFAGMILTIGVAADANIVVFERIKEEVRAGKSVRAAIAAGYSKGFHTILDANAVTCITALVLFAVATAGVKGFALMLLIGTVISLITAVAATRALLGLLAGFRWFDNPRFMGAQGQQTAKWLQIDFMRRRYLWFAISAAIVLISAVSLGVRGLNLGIDFKGGTQLTFKTQRPIAIDDVRSVTARIGRSDAVIQGRGQATGGKYRSFQIRTESLSGAEQTRLTRSLKERYGNSISIGIKNVSSSFGRQIARAAILAIIVSILLIVLYISIRFDWKFSVPVILALVHDIVITVGIYSLTAREVGTSTVAAVLTVLGYSIYDTIIIFDRVRENIPLMRSSSFATIANVSLWETIRRSLATTLITLLPVTALLLFGGATLKDFAFALLVGIGSGAYSSIFIATPLLTIWKEREPEYRRRIGTVDEGRRAERVLEEATIAAAFEPPPELVSVGMAAGDGEGDRTAVADGKPRGGAAAQSKRERRRQRRRARPHGRSR